MTSILISLTLHFSYKSAQKVLVFRVNHIGIPHNNVISIHTITSIFPPNKMSLNGGLVICCRFIVLSQRSCLYRTSMLWVEGAAGVLRRPDYRASGAGPPRPLAQCAVPLTGNTTRAHTAALLI